VRCDAGPAAGVGPPIHAEPPHERAPAAAICELASLVLSPAGDVTRQDTARAVQRRDRRDAARAARAGRAVISSP
jgi:hypothetical protein